MSDCRCFVYERTRACVRVCMQSACANVNIVCVCVCVCVRVRACVCTSKSFVRSSNAPIRTLFLPFFLV
jgi:hypothetical protein